MQILAHRGWWLQAAEKNCQSAFERALFAGYGIETDVRDCDGLLVISHDMPRRTADPSKQMNFDSFLHMYSKIQSRPTLALNIKSDGIAAPLQSALRAHGVESYFTFDMSVPDTLGYLKAGMPVFTRRSEYEVGSHLDSSAQGYWLDAFELPFVPLEIVKNAVASGKSTAIVSPELHSKPHLEAWSKWRDFYIQLSPDEQNQIMLCTDFPKDAEAYFTY